ncbi:MAG: acyl--CoA ligase [Actinomycetota bacterium]|nr:acyl--CoA ligase [Actinomycetota bacterium]
MSAPGGIDGDARLDELLSDAARAHGERVAIRDDEGDHTFAALDRTVGRVAARLAGLGVLPGERVVVRMSNRVELPVTVLGLARLGAVSIMVSPAWKQREVEHSLAVTGARRALVDRDDDGLIGTLLGGDAVHDVTSWTDPADDVAADDVAARDVAADGLAGTAPAATVAAGDDVVLVFSSGTTGLPKAVRHTHRSLRAATRHWVDALDLSADDRFQISTPPSHILGLLNLLAAVMAGATVRLHRRFDLERELATIEQDRLTLEMAVAPIVLAFAHHPDLDRFDLSSLRYVMWGATPVTPSVAETVTARTGVPILAAYGASEVPVLAVNPVRSPTEWRLDSPGPPPAGVELRVVDTLTGRVLPDGQPGELEARSPSTMAGYLPAAADADAFHDGWYRTGDIATLDAQGWVRLTDRAKDMIKVNGHQVAPAEIESVLLGHPGVQDCAVFGVPDPRTGEAPVAAVALDPAVPVDDDTLRGLVDEQLAGYKRLRSVVRVAAIPRLPSGKALRRELREQWATQHPAEGEDPT